ncbi:MAG: radical SAM family heme chaperone HemW [Steroidobacteraceae bacterium]|jgi:oxygen-independent coproporphyrinogen-3 oxidase
MSAGALPLTLYVHMPWCVRKCPYCDFNSHQLKSAAPSKDYIGALIRDFESELPDLGGRSIDAIFFGGGTPSLFAPEDFARLLDAFAARCTLAADVEVTLEANPGTIERGRFAGYRDAGINRVSLGAQTFAPRALARLGRIHSPEDTFRAVEELHAAGLANFNLDLMYALPEQGLEEALEDVRRACALEPRHISHYQLTLEPGTVFHSLPPALPDEDVAFRMQSECQALLAQSGFEHYEVSAYAREGARCRHNLNYWRFGDYVGIGAGAHGKITASLPHGVQRTEKARQPRAYLEDVGGIDGNGNIARKGNIDEFGGAIPQARRIGERKPVLASDLPFEFMLNALRLNDGFALADFESRTGLGAGTVEPRLRAALERGLLEFEPPRWRASGLGRRFLNDLQAGFLP